MESQLIDIDDIQILPHFQSSTPSSLKIKLRITNYKKYNNFPPVTVEVNDGEYTLIDGYTTYIAAKRLKIKKIQCVIKDGTYVSPHCRSSKKMIYEKYDGKCYICGREVKLTPYNEEPMQMTIDHIIPISKSGTNDIDNLACCCKVCNGLKGDFTYSDELKTVIIGELKERQLL